MDEGWILDESAYLKIHENNTLNTWLNETVHDEMKKMPFSSKDMKEYYTTTSAFGNRMIPILEQMKLRHKLRKEEFF